MLPAQESFNSGAGIILATCSVTVGHSHFFQKLSFVFLID